jgi:hypothetical protein
MATNIYSGKTAAERENERKYLNNLVSQGGGNSEWAKSQLSQLNEAEKTTPKTYNTSTNTTSPVESTSNWTSLLKDSTTPIPSTKKASNTGSKSYTDLISSTSVADDYGNSYNTTKGYSSPSSTGDSLVTKSNAQNIDEYLKQYGIDTDIINQYNQQQQINKNPYEEAMKMYDEQQKYIKEQQAAANKAALNQGIERLNSQLSQSNKSFDEAGRQAYIRATQSEYALPNQLNAMGYTGGLSETETARLKSGYQNTLSDLEKQRLAAQQEVYTAINNLRNTADQRTAQENIALAQEYANKLLELQVQASQYDKSLADSDWNEWKAMASYLPDYAAEIQKLQAQKASGINDPKLDQKISYLQYLRQQKVSNQEKETTESSQQKWDNDYQKAKLMADMGDFSGLKGLGYDTTALEKQWQADLSKSNALKMLKEADNSAYDLATNINNQYLNNATGKAAGDAVIVDNGNGGYTINPNISRGSYLDPIIARAFDSDMSDAEVKTFLRNLGISDDEISRVASYYLK